MRRQQKMFTKSGPFVSEVDRATRASVAYTGYGSEKGGVPPRTVATSRSTCIEAGRLSPPRVEFAIPPIAPKRDACLTWIQPHRPNSLCPFMMLVNSIRCGT